MLYMFLFIFSKTHHSHPEVSAHTGTDIELAGLFSWLSWCVTWLTCTAIISNCVGADRIRTTNS